MSRPLRIEYAGAFYHVMNRGADRCPIFLDAEADRALFKKTIGEAVAQWKIRIHAFSLMGNHYHLLMETPLPNLSRAMRHIDGVYTQRFNRCYRRDGPLMRGRFKSILVERESYFLELVRYIHLNGVKAKLVPSPDLDVHSSHWDYLHPQQATPWLEQSLVLSHFEKAVVSPRDGLAEFVQQGIPNDLQKILSQKKWPAILGAKAFVASVRDTFLKSAEKNRELPQKNHLLSTKKLDADVVRRVVAEVYQGATHAREQRWALMYFLQRYSYLKLKEIGVEMGGLSYKTVQKYLLRNDFKAGMNVGRLEKRFQEMSHVAT